MNKLEQAIRKTADAQFYGSSVFGASNTSGIEEIAKMETSFLLDHDELKKKKIIYPSMKDSKLLNSFRELRSSITDHVDKNIVMVTAIGNKSGTSFFARNVASAIAFDTSKTALLMDCNNRNSEVGELFNLENNKGIAEYVSSSNLSVGDIINESGVKRLRVIPFGSENEQVDEQYSHPRFIRLLEEIKNQYRDRHIILDSPPILNSADSRILLNLCDQVVLVVPYGKVSKSNLEEAISIIGREKFTGVVFNDYLG